MNRLDTLSECFTGAFRFIPDSRYHFPGRGR